VADQLYTGQFPVLINALHSTDIAMHPHPSVTIAYFDVCVRYLDIASPQSLDMFAGAMTGSSGLRHTDLQVRCRASYNLLKVTEGLEPKAFILLAHVNAFAGTFPFPAEFALLCLALPCPSLYV
jgi:hypothetical protein